MRRSWKHHQAAKEMEPAIKEIRRRGADTLTVCPRNIEHIISLFPVAIEKHENLTLSIVSNTLQQKYGVRGFHASEDVRLGGYVVASGGSAVIFAETSRGDRYTRFSLAHEFGHYMLEHFLILDAQSAQYSLFDFDVSSCDRLEISDTNPTLERSVGRRRRYDLREVRANAFAAELLMPYDEILRHARTAEVHLEDLFGVSRAAVEIRLKDLGSFQDDNPTLV
jgi:Zn-dependent peptidase ImmA (M78 family)